MVLMGIVIRHPVHAMCVCRLFAHACHFVSYWLCALLCFCTSVDVHLAAFSLAGWHPGSTKVCGMRRIALSPSVTATVPHPSAHALLAHRNHLC